MESATWKSQTVTSWFRTTLRWNYTASLERSFHKQLAQYNVRFESHQNGSCGSSQCSYQCTTFPVQRSPVRTDWWRGYGVPLGPLLANVLMSHIEENLHQEGKLPWSFYRRYIDDTLTVMLNIETASNFLDTLNKAPFSIKFTMETEYSGMLPFLGIQLLNQSPQIEAKLYMKPTKSGLLLHYQSHVDNRDKKGFLLDRAYRLSSSWTHFSDECDHLKTVFSPLKYSKHLINSTFKSFVDSKVCDQQQPLSPSQETDNTIRVTRKWLSQIPYPPRIPEFYTRTKIHKPTITQQDQ